MASFPTPKVHRPSRRKLARGQYPQLPAAQVTVTPATAVVTLDFDQPMIVSGVIDLNLARVSPAPPALLSQVVVSTTQVVQTYASTVVGCDWEITGVGVPARTFQGGSVAASAGTF